MSCRYTQRCTLPISEMFAHYHCKCEQSYDSLTNAMVHIVRVRKWKRNKQPYGHTEYYQIESPEHRITMVLPDRMEELNLDWC